MQPAFSRRPSKNGPGRYVKGLVLGGFALTMAGCGDESLSGYGGADHIWVLQQLDGEVFDASATLVLAKGGDVSGQAPCNSYRGSQTAPYPWFQIDTLATTRSVCPELMAEVTYLQALQEMREAEVAGEVLILRNSEGREMVFRAKG